MKWCIFHVCWDRDDDDDEDGDDVDDGDYDDKSHR